MRVRQGIPAALLFAVLVSCGRTAVPALPARVTVSPPALLFTSAGEAQALTATAYDANGKAIAAPVTWASSSPDVTVGQDGRVTATAGVGSAVITARVAGVESNPVLVIAAEPVPGASLLTDDQVASGPTLLGAISADGVGSRYAIGLAGVTLAPGSVIIGKGSRAIAGKVVAAHDGQVEVEVVPLNQVFRNLKLSARIPLANLPLEPESGAAAPAGMQSLPGGLTRLDYAPQAVRPLATEFALPPFKCERDLQMPTFSATAVSLTLENAVDLDFDLSIVDGSVTHVGFQIQGTPKVKAGGSISFGASFQGSLKCQARLGKVTIPVPPAIAAIVVPVVPFGFGFSLEGKFNVGSAGVELSGEYAADAKIGFDYTSTSGFQGIREFTGKPDGGLKPLLSPSQFASLEAGGEGFAFTGLSLENPLLSLLVANGLEFSILESTLGLRQDLKLALPDIQALDATYSSSYDLKFRFKIGLGSDFAKLFQFLDGSTKLFDFSFQNDTILAESPTGSASADVEGFQPGDRVRFTVTLDPANLTYPVIGYNVDHLRILRKTAGGVVEVASVPVTLPNQRTFTVDWTAPDAGSVAGNFFAFVVTKLLPLDPTALEFATITAQPGQCVQADALHALSDGCQAPPPPACTELLPRQPTWLEADTGQLQPVISQTGSPVDSSNVTATGSSTAHADFGAVTASAGTSVSGVSPTLAGHFGSGEWGDHLVILPNDPALIGQSFTLKGRVRVTGHLAVSASDDLPFAILQAKIDISSIERRLADPGEQDIDEYLDFGLYTRFGTAIYLEGQGEAISGFAYHAPPEPAPVSGSASASVKVQWAGITEVSDANGNPVPYTVCSKSGKNW